MGGYSNVSHDQFWDLLQCRDEEISSNEFSLSSLPPVDRVFELSEESSTSQLVHQLVEAQTVIFSGYTEEQYLALTPKCRENNAHANVTFPLREVGDRFPRALALLLACYSPPSTSFPSNTVQPDQHKVACLHHSCKSFYASSFLSRLRSLQNSPTRKRISSRTLSPFRMVRLSSNIRRVRRTLKRLRLELHA